MDTDDRPQAWVEIVSVAEQESFGLGWQDVILETDLNTAGVVDDKVSLLILRRP